MKRGLIVLRPEPAASATAARATERGLAATVAPLFEVASLSWAPPDPAGFDAILLTSANAARHGGAALARYRHLPIYAVGEATAAAARAAGFVDVTAGDADGTALIGLAAAGGARRLLHLAGREHRPPAHAGMIVEHRTVYAANAVERLPARAAGALAAGAVALIHSPRAATLFRQLVAQAGLAAGTLRLAAISPAALAAAGDGWASAAAADAPSDDALLAAAACMCD